MTNDDKDFNTCSMCKGTGRITRFSEEIIRCPKCKGTGIDDSKHLCSTPQQPNDDKDLKCPFCSGENISEHGLRVGPKPFYRCNDCGACAKKELWKIQPTPQQPSEPLKELKKLSPHQLHDIAKGNADIYCELMVLHGYAKRVKFKQPSEKKALSVEKLMEIIDLSAGFNIGKNNRWLIAQAIFDAMPNEKKALSVEDVLEKLLNNYLIKRGYLKCSPSFKEGF